MRIIKLGERRDNPCFFDISCCLPPPGHSLCKAFRMGDRAAAHVIMLTWRRANPQRKLVVTANEWKPEVRTAKLLEPAWLFEGIADEAWLAEREHEPLPLPPGERLYYHSIWKDWRGYIVNGGYAIPTIRPPGRKLEEARAELKRAGAPAVYCTVQPLFDAKYNFWRNNTSDWWKSFMFHLAKKAPIVLLANRECSSRLGALPSGIFRVVRFQADVLAGMSALSCARMHVGGDTGFTHWAAVFGVPIVACYAHWHANDHGNTDYRPVPFKAPVVFAQLKGAPEEAAFVAENVYRGAITSTTPMG
jgi:hypothetical protein